MLARILWSVLPSLALHGGSLAQGTDLRSLLGGAGPVTAREHGKTESDALAASSDTALNVAQQHYFDYVKETKNEEAARARALAARRRLSDLETAKVRILDEMRRGAFCRACRRTRSQVEASGENWQRHLDENSEGVPVAATTQELADKSREFDDSVAETKGEEARAHQEADAAAKASTAAKQDLIDSFVPWRVAMLQEDQARARSWDAKMNDYKERFASSERQIAALDADVARARSIGQPPEVISRLLAQREAVAERMRQMSSVAGEEYFARRAQAGAFQERLEKGRNQLESFIEEVGGPPFATLSNLVTLPTIPTAPDVLPLLGTASTSPTSLAVSINGPGAFSMSLRASSDWLRSELNVDVVLGVGTGMGDPIEVGVRRTSSPSGVTDSPIGNSPDAIKQGRDILDVMMNSQKK